MTVPTQHLISLRHALAVARTKGTSRTASELEAIIRDLEPKEPSLATDSFQVARSAAVKLNMHAGTKTETRAFPVTTITPSPAAWKAALKAAGGDASRCIAVDENTVIVSNNSRHTRR